MLIPLYHLSAYFIKTPIIPLLNGSCQIVKAILFCIAICVVALETTPNAVAGTATLLGSITLHQEYDSNIYRSNQDEIWEWTSHISPLLSFSSEGKANKFAITYYPDLLYNNRTFENTVNHNISLLSSFETQHLALSLSETFIQGENPYSDEQIDFEITDKRGKNKYTANNMALTMSFYFSKNDFLSVGYSHYSLDNEDPALEDFDRLQPRAALGFYFSPRWQTMVSHATTFGDFEKTENLTTHKSDITISNYLTPLKRIFVHYSYSTNDYAGTKPDYQYHDSSIGYANSPSPSTSFSSEIGASVAERDYTEDTTTAFLLVEVTHKSRNGTYSLIGKSGFEGLYYNGAQDGLSQYWQTKANISYRLMKNLQTSIHAQYREDTYIEKIPETDEQYIQSGALLSIGFFRWYTFRLNYLYSRLYSDIETNEYIDHRFFVELRAEKELWIW